jgi:hypothetical protein
MVLLADLLTSAMFAVGCGLLTAIMLRRSYRYFGSGKRRGSQSPIDAQPRPTSEWSGAYTDSSARIERQKVELHEQHREASARLDNKLVLLQELCAKSQQQIDRMETLLAEIEERTPDRALQEKP